jgi:hypothetical protein
VGGGVGLEGNRTLMETFLAFNSFIVDSIRAVVGDGVGDGNRTVMETFLACKIVDLIRARIESNLAFRIQESTVLILA